MNNEIIRNIENRLEQNYGWNHPCAHTFATFLSVSNENNTDCLPENHPYWCDFIITVHTLKQSQRPMAEQIMRFLIDEMGWGYESENEKECSAYYLSVEYKKCLILLDDYAEAINEGLVKV